MSIKYSLSLLEKFTCLGADCPDDCCHDWNLHIDSQTLSKWKKIKNESLRHDLLQSISIINEDGQAVEVVKQQDDSRCVHLSVQGWCTIQQRCGHEFLPETCRQYPRETLSNNAAQLHTAHLSCPGIIQLLSKQDSTEELFKVENLGVKETSQLESNSKEYAEFLEQTVVCLLIENKDSLSVRLYYIAIILERIAVHFKQANMDEKKLIKTCQQSSKNIAKQLADIQKQRKHNKLKINKKNSGIYWQLVFSTCRVLRDNEISKRLEASKTFKRLEDLNSLNLDLSDQHYFKYFNLFQKVHTAMPAAIVTKIDSILTKYILVKFKNHGFPWYLYKNSLELTFLDCVVSYNQIKLLLCLLYESENKISENDIITTIYKVEKTVAHNTLILQQLEHRSDLLQIASYAGCWING